MGEYEPGDSIGAGTVVAVIAPSDVAAGADLDAADTWGPTLGEIRTLQSLADERFAPGSTDPGVVRQRNRGKFTCRERIAMLLDDGSFREVGSVAGFASYGDDGSISAFTPANHVGGWGTIEGRQAIVCADDFTSRGGHSDGAIGARRCTSTACRSSCAFRRCGSSTARRAAGASRRWCPNSAPEPRQRPRRASVRSRPAGHTSPAVGIVPARPLGARSTPNSSRRCP